MQTCYTNNLLTGQAFRSLISKYSDIFVSIIKNALYIMIRYTTTVLLVLVSMTTLWAQSSLADKPQLVDRIIATVGNSYILQSDLEMEYTQYLASGNPADEGV